jgi:succinate-semialdehyde dehydrogenase/glutarate-semialdehyde dehydrogenase
MRIQSINPASGELITTYEPFTHAELEAIVVAADRASIEWRHTSFDRRGQALEAVAVLLEERADALAGLMAREMGKPLADGRAEVEKCAWVCRYYAGHGAAHLAPIEIPTDAAYSGVVFEPLGVVLAVMPWNFPLWQVFRAAAPTLCAGNTMLLKHASNVTGCGLAIESLFHDAGAPPSAFRTIIVPSDRIADLIAAPEIRAVTLTGSTGAGRAVAAAAGKHLKPCLLELGGSDPYIVLEDADLELAAAKCAESRLINSGQSCIAA